MKTIFAIATVLILACSAHAAGMLSKDLPRTNRVQRLDLVHSEVLPLGTNSSQNSTWADTLDSLKLFPEWPTALPTNNVPDDVATFGTFERSTGLVHKFRAIVQGTNTIIFTNAQGALVINASAAGGGGGGSPSPWSFDSDGSLVPGFDSQ